MNGLCFPSDANPCPSDRKTRGLVALGFSVFSLGLAGTIFSAIRLRKHKRERASLTESGVRKPARVQWDPAKSRFVF